MASDLYPADVAALRRDPQHAAGFHEMPRLSTYVAAFNTHSGPLQDIRLPRRLIQAVDVNGLGSAIRHQTRFAPDGTNVNFLQVSGTGSHLIRTYERGVEAETLACGTGVAAAALLLSRQDAAESPVSVRVAGGAELSVAFEVADGMPCNVMLEGPVAHVYQGTLEYAE